MLLLERPRGLVGVLMAASGSFVGPGTASPWLSFVRPDVLRVHPPRGCGPGFGGALARPARQYAPSRTSPSCRPSASASR